MIYDIFKTIPAVFIAMIITGLILTVLSIRILVLDPNEEKDSLLGL